MVALFCAINQIAPEIVKFRKIQPIFEPSRQHPQLRAVPHAPPSPFLHGFDADMNIPMQSWA